VTTGTDNRDVLNADADGAWLKGGAGDDQLTGDQHTDILDGGQGNDLLFGSGGNDTYVFGRGDGQDTIYEYEFQDNSQQDALFLKDLNPSDVRMTRELDDNGYSTDLLIQVIDSADSIRVTNFFNHTAYQIESITFENGTVWGLREFNALPVVATGSRVYGTIGNDIIDLRNSVHTTVLNNNTKGQDTYVFARGAGQDTIQTPSGECVVNLTDLNATDVTFIRETTDNGQGTHLLMQVNGSTDSLRVSDFYAATNYQIKQVVFADGSSLTSEAFLRLPFLATSTLFFGQYGDDIIDLRQAVGTTVYTYAAGNDTYMFDKGAGQDTIRETDWSVNQDKVMLGANLTAEQTILTRVGDDLVLTWANAPTDQLTLGYYFGGAAFQMELIQFADGTEWDVGTVMSKIAQNGTDNMDFMFGNDGYANRINGNGGDDYLFGKALNDTLSGGTGQDRLFGGAGADRFVFDVTPSEINQDWIQDFRISDQDSLILDSAVFTALQAGQSLEGYFRLSSQAVTGENDYLVYNPNTGQVFYDSTGQDQQLSTAVVLATLATQPYDLSYQQFQVI
jgi:Ca2+-binding RTX toxin-like protein